VILGGEGGSHYVIGFLTKFVSLSVDSEGDFLIKDKTFSISQMKGVLLNFDRLIEF
jgi:hypothetical protein